MYDYLFSKKKFVLYALIKACTFINFVQFSKIKPFFTKISANFTQKCYPVWLFNPVWLFIFWKILPCTFIRDCTIIREYRVRNPIFHKSNKFFRIFRQSTLHNSSLNLTNLFVEKLISRNFCSVHRVHERVVKRDFHCTATM